MNDAIIEKLNDLINRQRAPTEECHVVYVMVEIRKILDHDRNSGTIAFPLLRFYSDWVVHISKDKITPEIANIMSEVFKSIKFAIEHPAMVRADHAYSRIVYMDNLKGELVDCFNQKQINIAWFENGNWNLFVSLLVKVLEDQPIVNPVPEMKSFSFIPAEMGCVKYRADFAIPINGYDYFDFGNCY